MKINDIEKKEKILSSQRRDNYIKGKAGEDIAVYHLQRDGYEIIERNYRCKQGEIDIIAKDRECLVFIEVKSRYNNKFGQGSEAITTWKVDKIKKAALNYLNRDCEVEYESVRFDAVEVYFMDKKVWIKRNAFI